MYIGKLDDLEKKIKFLLDYILELKKLNLEYSKQISENKIKIKMKDLDLFEFNKKILDYEKKEKKYRDIKKRLEFLLEKIEKLEYKL
jgi:hypothetical protein